MLSKSLSLNEEVMQWLVPDITDISKKNESFSENESFYSLQTSSLYHSMDSLEDCDTVVDEDEFDKENMLIGINRKTELNEMSKFEEDGNVYEYICYNDICDVEEDLNAMPDISEYVEISDKEGENIIFKIPSIAESEEDTDAEESPSIIDSMTDEEDTDDEESNLLFEEDSDEHEDKEFISEISSLIESQSEEEEDTDTEESKLLLEEDLDEELPSTVESQSDEESKLWVEEVSEEEPNESDDDVICLNCRTFVVKSFIKKGNGSDIKYDHDEGYLRATEDNSEAVCISLSDCESVSDSGSSVVQEVIVLSSDSEDESSICLIASEESECIILSDSSLDCIAPGSEREDFVNVSIEGYSCNNLLDKEDPTIQQNIDHAFLVEYSEKLRELSCEVAHELRAAVVHCLLNGVMAAIFGAGIALP